MTTPIMELIVDLCKNIMATNLGMKNFLGEIVRLWKIGKNDLNKIQISNTLKRENIIEKMTRQISRIEIEDLLGNNFVDS